MMSITMLVLHFLVCLGKSVGFDWIVLALDASDNPVPDANNVVAFKGGAPAMSVRRIAACLANSVAHSGGWTNKTWSPSLNHCVAEDTIGFLRNFPMSFLLAARVEPGQGGAGVFNRLAEICS